MRSDIGKQFSTRLPPFIAIIKTALKKTRRTFLVVDPEVHHTIVVVVEVAHIVVAELEQEVLHLLLPLHPLKLEQLVI